MRSLEGYAELEHHPHRLFDGRRDESANGAICTGDPLHFRQLNSQTIPARELLELSAACVPPSMVTVRSDQAWGSSVTRPQTTPTRLASGRGDHATRSSRQARGPLVRQVPPGRKSARARDQTTCPPRGSGSDHGTGLKEPDSQERIVEGPEVDQVVAGARLSYFADAGCQSLAGWLTKQSCQPFVPIVNRLAIDFE